MEWLRRKKETAPPEPALAEEDVRDHVLEQRQSEIKSVEQEITGRRGSLESITEKLAIVKTEYDEAVSKLMETKKELNQKRRELESIDERHTDAARRAESEKAQLEAVQNDVKNKRHEAAELDKANSVLAEAKSEISRLQGEELQMRKKTADAQRGLDSAISLRQKAEAELRDLTRRLTEARRELDSPAAPNTDPGEKSIVEAASTVVASLTRRLHASEKEIEAVKRLLEKERLSHEETRRSTS